MLGSESGGEPVATLEPGTQIEHYRVLRLLGQGGMGAVYLARDTVLGRKAALKVVHQRLVEDLNSLERFMLEARATARFNHPNIVTIYAVGEWQNSAFIALEYLEGQTLRERLLAEALSAPEAARIALAIARALEEAHSQGVMHRDLKPENVLLPRDGRLRVVDFGLAKLLGDEPPVAAELPPISLPEASGAQPTEDAREGDDHTATQVQGNGSAIDPASTPVVASDPRQARTVSGRSSRPRVGTVGLVGTPLYMAPEQWRQQQVNDAADIWALGVILHEMLYRQRPFAASSLRELRDAVISAEPTPPQSVPGFDVPAELAALVSRCLDKSARERPHASEVIEVLEGVLQESRPRIAKRESPFRGLMAFGEQHAGLFFGRDAEVAAFLERMRTDPVLPIVGASGAGKTSFVNAGVIPRLKEQGAWTILRLRPGAAPFETLAARLIKGESTLVGGSEFRLASSAYMDRAKAEPSTEELARVAQELFEQPKRLALHLQRLAEFSRARVLLLVDQLEEVTTLVKDDKQRRRFVEVITGAADDVEEPVRVLFTVRDDFFVRVSEGLDAPEAMSRVMVLHPPGEAALREILLGPLRAVAYTYDDPLVVDEMIQEVAGEPSSLPLLQFTTRMMWERRDERRRCLTRASYDAIGGVGGALATHAETIMGSLSREQVRVVRDLLLRLVTPEGTRRVVGAEALLEGLASEAKTLLQRLLQARLLAIRTTLGEPHVELAHETLISRWRQLAEWLEEGSEELAFLAEIGQAAQLWHQRGRREQEVWVGTALAEAERNTERFNTKLVGSVAEFMRACRAAARRKERRKRFLVGGSIAALALIAVVSVVVALAFAEKEAETRTEKVRAERQGAETQTESARAAYFRGRRVEARTKLRGALEKLDSASSRALWWRFQAEPLQWQLNLGKTLMDVAFVPGGELVAVAALGGSIYLLDPRTLAIRSLRGQRHRVNSLAASQDGTLLAYGDDQGGIGIWDLERLSVTPARGHRAQVWRIAFAPSKAQVLASVSGDGSLRLWDAKNGESMLTMQAPARLTSVEFTPDAQQVVTGTAQGEILVWSVSSGKLVATLKGHSGAVHGLAFSLDGERLASGAEDKTVRLWDMAQIRAEELLAGHTAPVTTVAFFNNGTRLVTGSYDQTIRIWNTDSQEELYRLEGHTGAVLRLSVLEHERLLVSCGSDDSVRLWDLSAGRNERRETGHKGAAIVVAIAPDGALVASAGSDNAVHLWNVATGEEQWVVSGHDGLVMGLNFSPDGQLLASGGWDGTIRIWDIASRSSAKVLHGHESAVYEVLFVDNGTRLLSAGFDSTVRLWNIDSGVQEGAVADHSDAVTGLGLSPDGRLLAVSGGLRTIALWDVASRQRLPLPGIDQDTEIATFWSSDVEFSPDGSLIASASHDGAVRVWDPHGKGSLEQIFPQPASQAFHVAFHPDGRRLAAAYVDGVARIWDRQTRQAVELRGHIGEVSDVRFSADGQLAATAGEDGTVRLWEPESGKPLWRSFVVIEASCEALTHQGWIDLRSGVNLEEPTRTAWRQAVEQRAQRGYEQGGWLCFENSESGVELWDLEADRQVQRFEIAELEELVVIPNGCLALSSGRARLLRIDKQVNELAANVEAMAWDGEEILVAREGEILMFDTKGDLIATHEGSRDVTALTRIDELFVLGFADGMMELMPVARWSQRASFVFEETPAGRVMRLTAGPSGTVIAGYSNGSMGIWDLRDGAKLHHLQLHGPVAYLVEQKDHLFAVSELGGHVALDLSVFHLPYCELMEQIWKRVPARWESGVAVLRGPPKEHPCSQLVSSNTTASP